ncbi:uncharacterized protein LOC142638397 [Castanea sativa]|uniref:uncharacterized protein LOC142638397 n=1 Tax=Castanea sativa TaxID=21020 RepID=UPI003F64BA47
MGEEAADDQTPFFQTQPAEHPLHRTDYMDILHQHHQPSTMSSSTSSHAPGSPWMQFCHCGKIAPVKTSWTGENIGRRFWACEKYGVDDTCGYFVWLDPPPCARGRELLPLLREKIDSLEKEVAASHAKEKNERINTKVGMILCFGTFAAIGLVFMITLRMIG